MQTTKTKAIAKMKSPKTNPLTLALALAAMTSLLASNVMAQDGGPGRKGRKGPKGSPGKALMERFDANKDGKLSEEERENARSAMKAARGAADTDGDGKISESEHLAAFKKHLSENEQLAARVLARFDEDGSGDLSDAELAKAAKRSKAAREGKREGNGQKKGRRGGQRRGKRSDLE